MVRFLQVDPAVTYRFGDGCKILYSSCKNNKITQCWLTKIVTKLFIFVVKGAQCAPNKIVSAVILHALLVIASPIATKVVTVVIPLVFRSHGAEL